MLRVIEVYTFDTGLCTVRMVWRPKVVVVAFSTDTLPIITVVGHIHVGSVVQVSSYLIGKAQRKGYAFVGDRGIDAPIHFGNGIADDGVVGIVIVISSSAPVILKISGLAILGVIYIVDVLAVGLVHTCPFVSIESQRGLTFPVYILRTAVATGGVVPDNVRTAIQLFHLRTEEGCVDTGTP